MGREHLIAEPESLPKDPKKNPKNDVFLSSLDVLAGLDVTWTVVWEGAIYMMNLWVIFLSDNAEDMVLNCLAGQFLTKVDGEIVALYLKIYDIDTFEFVSADRREAGWVGSCWFLVSLFSYVVGFSYSLITIITLVFGPVCEP